MTEISYEHPLDKLILHTADAEWQNVTTVISAVFNHPEFVKEEYAAQDVAERIYILYDNGYLEAQGNIRRWRQGQIKRKALPAATTQS